MIYGLSRAVPTALYIFIFLGGMTMTVKKYDNGKWGYYFGHEGKRYRKQGYKTKREATEGETQAKNQLMQGMIINNKSSFIEYYNQWIDVNKKMLSLIVPIKHL